MLIAVPNVSEGRDAAVLSAVAGAYARAGARVLDVHSDPDHHRSVFTLAAARGVLAGALAAGVQAALDHGVTTNGGIHPHVGAVDVVPVVFRAAGERGAACAEALTAAHEIGERGVPVLIYGLLADGRTRAELRRGGPRELARRLDAREISTDFGPAQLHERGGATLVAARPPLLAFNVELSDRHTLEDAKRIASILREELPATKALGLRLQSRSGVAQVSVNVEDHTRTTLADVVHAVAEHADVAEAEVVGLPPQRAFEGFPDDVPVRNRRTLEQALALDSP